jgi:hypothetical protein
LIAELKKVLSKEEVAQSTADRALAKEKAAWQTVE